MARKNKQEQPEVVSPVVNNVEATKGRSHTMYSLADQSIQVYATEGHITRFILNDRSNNSFEMTIEEE